MDPVSVSIILTTIGWLAKIIFKNVVDETWKLFTKGEGLDGVTDELIAELKSFKVPVETAETINYLKEVKKLVIEAKDLLDELDYFRLKKEVKQMNIAERGNILTRFKSEDIPSSSTALGSFKKLQFDKSGLTKRMKELITKLKEKKCESLYPTLENQQLSKIVESVEKMNNPIVRTDRQTDSYNLEDKIYGRDGEIRKIQNIIKHAEQHPQKIPVIALVGHGGAGKTTLAQEIYKNFTPSFEPKMWITVSTNFDEMEIICQMLQYRGYNVSYDKKTNKNFLKKELEAYLKDKQYLFVLDDIWEMSEKEWTSLLAPLKSHAGSGSMVLVTTRDPSIAKMVSTTDPIDLDGLDDDSFWSFFIKCAFGNDGHNLPPLLEYIGREIIEKLSGNPLAAKTVGNLLKSENNPIKWAEILDREEWKYLEGESDIMPTLRLSYEYLPLHLKQCFSYCSLFPKNHYFKAEELVYMWMAQGFINTNDKRVEDVGFEYFNILVQRAFFQKVTKRNGEVAYVLHDLMHDLAQVVSSQEFLAINQPIKYSKTLISSNFHHLSFLLDADYTIELHIQFENLCSLVIFENSNSLEDPIEWDQANRVRLRVLILPYVRSTSYNFSHFIHLRYLKLNYGQYFRYGEEEATFPVQICTLYHLQVLALELSWIFAEELPKEFNNLVNLRNFIANEGLHSKIAGVGRLKHLQELKQFVVREEKGFELSQLSELNELRGSLGIYDLENVKSKEEAESVKLSEKKIVELKQSWTNNKVKWTSQDKRQIGKHVSASSEEILEALRPNSELLRVLRIENYGGFKSPSWLTDHSIRYLESITLSNCGAWEVLPNFGQLMGLKELYLSKLSRVKSFGQQFHGRSPREGFPSLKVMVVKNMDELQTWDWDHEDIVFSSLEKLEVYRCPKLSEFSLLNPVGGTQWFPKLDSLRIEDCPKLQQDVPAIFPSIYASQIVVAEIKTSFFIGIKYNRSINELSINAMEEPKIWDPITTFQNICSMDVKRCYDLTSLSWKCICMLRSLKRLNYIGCYELCFSPVLEEKDDGTTFYSQESLEELLIEDCGVSGKELSYLLAHLPVIRKLSIIDCNETDSISLRGINIDEPRRAPSPYLLQSKSRSPGAEFAIQPWCFSGGVFGAILTVKKGPQPIPTRKAPLEEGGEVVENQQRRPGALACLEELEITECPNMVLVNEEGLSGLTALREVTIVGSEKLLYSMNENGESNSVHTLIVRESNVTHLKLYSFIALRKLELYKCKELIAVEGPAAPACPEVLIEDCPHLVSSRNLIHPKFLMPVGKLQIDNKDFLSFHASNFSKSLLSLTISTSFSHWTAKQENALIKHLTVLQELTLYNCRGLCFLPETLNEHPSLKELTINECPEIKSLPEKGFPQSLQKLHLICCSEKLKNQCSECSQLEHFECSIPTDDHRRKEKSRTYSRLDSAVRTL